LILLARHELTWLDVSQPADASAPCRSSSSQEGQRQGTLRNRVEGLTIGVR